MPSNTPSIPTAPASFETQSNDRVLHLNAFLIDSLLVVVFLNKCIVIQFFRCIFYTIYRSRRFCSNCRCRIRYPGAGACPQHHHTKAWLDAKRV